MNAVEIPTYYHHWLTSPTGALAAQIDANDTDEILLSRQCSVFGLYRSREDWTHSSAGAEYARLGLPAAVQSQVPRSSAPGRGPSK